MAEHIGKQDFIDRVFDFENEKEWKYKGSIPAIVDFYAEWCVPCKMLSPVLDELSKEYEGRLNVYKVDTDKEQELASLFNIQSVPSILFVPKDGAPQMALGALPKAQLKEAISEVLKLA